MLPAAWPAFRLHRFLGGRAEVLLFAAAYLAVWIGVAAVAMLAMPPAGPRWRSRGSTSWDRSRPRRSVAAARPLACSFAARAFAPASSTQSPAPAAVPAL